MASIAIYDPNDLIVPNRVIKFLSRAHSPDYSGNVLINPSLNNVENIPEKYWLVSGSSIVSMNDEQKNAIDLFFGGVINYSGQQLEAISINNTVYEEIFSITPNLRNIDYTIMWSAELSTSAKKAAVPWTVKIGDQIESSGTVQTVERDTFIPISSYFIHKIITPGLTKISFLACVSDKKYAATVRRLFIKINAGGSNV